MTTLEKQLQFFGTYLDKSGLDHKAYQFEGLRWCLEKETAKVPLCNVRGGFIADEMGLGKTIMMIGLMLCNFKKRTLVVVPPILVHQWNMQIYRTTGHRALVYHGTANKKRITLAMLEAAPVVITTYGSLISRTKRDGTVVKSALQEVVWQRVIYDEAHHLRNSKTELFRSAKLLKGKICWVVSGTPVQNNIKDFYSLCSIIGLPASFYTDKKNVELFGKHFLLKRTKKEVGIDMQTVQSSVIPVKWSAVEKQVSERIHESIVDAGRDKLVMMLLAKQSCIMSTLVAKHWRMLLHMGVLDDGLLKDAKMVKTQSKLDCVIASLLEKKDNGCGKLVFCHFRQEMDMIALRLRAEGVSVNVFDGRAVGMKKRQQLIEDAAQVLILQIQTGCEGLNLQDNYSEVYFVSPHWNPSVEEQAIARCHRVGQQKPVFIWRFVMSTFEKDNMASMDHYVVTIQDKKKELIKEIVG